MTDIEKQEIIAEVEDSVMEDCTIACQLLTWGKRGRQEDGNSKIKPDK